MCVGVLVCVSVCAQCAGLLVGACLFESGIKSSSELEIRVVVKYKVA